MRMRVVLAVAMLLPFLKIANAAVTAEEVAYIRTHPDATVADVTAAMKPSNRTTDRLWVFEGISQVVGHIGHPPEMLSGNWVWWLLVTNGLHHTRMLYMEQKDKRNFPTKSGERKVASYNQMNLKYVHWKRTTLFVHIISGTVAMLGSCLAIGIEGYGDGSLSGRIAVVASAAEVLAHAPTALMLSPMVYGDKGVTPFVYMVTSALLMISGISSLEESLDTSGGMLLPNGVRPELRRMCSTISIFLYVRLYGLLRSPAGLLRKQKYTVSVMTAGLAMMPVGWAPWIFPLLFWMLFAFNIKTVAKTIKLISEFGVDGAAERMGKLA